MAVNYRGFPIPDYPEPADGPAAFMEFVDELILQLDAAGGGFHPFLFIGAQ